MRIHLNLPAAASSSSTLINTSQIPSQLTALSPNGELLLIELQGALEIENQCAEGNQILGTIAFEKGREDRPVLMVSHHRLEGKFVNLIKPLAILEKKTRANHMASKKDMDTPKKSKRTALDQGETTPTAKKVKQSEIAPESSPIPATPARKRKDAMDFSSSPPYRTLDDMASTEPDGASDSSQDELDEEDEDESQTSVYYDVVNIIKRKILFSKRPEPIVKLGTEVTAVPLLTKALRQAPSLQSKT